MYRIGQASFGTYLHHKHMFWDWLPSPDVALDEMMWMKFLWRDWFQMENIQVGLLRVLWIGFLMWR